MSSNKKSDENPNYIIWFTIKHIQSFYLTFSTRERPSGAKLIITRQRCTGDIISREFLTFQNCLVNSHVQSAKNV
jgi:hypothetical protein